MKPRRAMMLAMLLTAGICAIAWMLPRPEAPLTAKAHAVANVREYNSKLGLSCPWEWISNRENLVTRQDEATIMPQGPNGPLVPVAVDVVTGRERRLDGPADRLARVLGSNPGLYYYYPALSPDKRWLLWDPLLRSAPGLVIAMSTDGSRMETWLRPRGENCLSDSVWREDSRGFVRLLRADDDDTKIVRIDEYLLGSPAVVRSMSLKGRGIVGDAIGMLPGNRALVSRMHSDNPSEIGTCTTIDVTDPRRAPGRIVLKPPLGRSIEALAVSPEADRLAWVTRSLPADFAGPARWRAIRRRLSGAPTGAAMEL